MVSREPTWAKKVPRIRLEMASREPTWAKKVPTSAKQVLRKTRWFQESQLGQRGPKDKLEMGFEESKLEQRRSQG